MELRLNYPLSIFRCPFLYGTSIDMSFPEKLKLGRLRPFMNLAAVCESAVMIIGSAIEGSHWTKAVVAPLCSLPNELVWPALYPGVLIPSVNGSVVILIAYLCPRGVVREMYDVISAKSTI